MKKRLPVMIALLAAGSLLAACAAPAAVPAVPPSESGEKYSRNYAEAAVPPAAAPLHKLRRCLGCGREFASQGPHHRQCKACRRREDVGLPA